jgi:hypothetical protein
MHRASKGKRKEPDRAASHAIPESEPGVHEPTPHAGSRTDALEFHKGLTAGCSLADGPSLHGLWNLPQEDPKGNRPPGRNPELANLNSQTRNRSSEVENLKTQVWKRKP